jgi:SAM-dependent methyltransferase
MSEPFSLDQAYDAYPRIEEEFQAALDASLSSRGPELLYDIVRDLQIPPGAAVVDVGCGEGKQALSLAERFGFDVTGFDPVHRHIELANQRLLAAADRMPEVSARVRFKVGEAEALPVDDESVDLVWCRDVLLHVAELEKAYREFRRVLLARGRVLVYQSSFATDRLEQREGEWIWKASGVVPTSADPGRTEAAIAAAGLRVDQRIEVGLEWGEWAQEQTGERGRRLLHAARLLRAPERYIEQFGQSAYDTMLADCLWHVYHMVGKLSARVYLLSPQ